jgi:hypothetical protein
MTRDMTIVGKRKADLYALNLRQAKIKFKRRKVGASSWRFTY